MKKQFFFFGIILLTIMYACSSDDNSTKSMTSSQLLVSESPWDFDHFELISIPGSMGEIEPELKIEIENEVNSVNNGSNFIFNQDGIGKLTLVNEEERNFDWQIINGNQLEIIFTGGGTVIFENILVESNALNMETEFLHEFEEDEPLIIFGRFYYN